MAILFRSAQINGSAAPGYSSDQAMEALEDVFAKTMPREMGFSYLGMSFQEKKAKEGVSPESGGMRIGVQGGGFGDQLLADVAGDLLFLLLFHPHSPCRRRSSRPAVSGEGSRARCRLRPASS